MKTDSFNITITPEMLRSMLRGMIEHEHGDIVTDVIVNHLDDYAVQQLYKAVHGIAPKVDVHLGQGCLIPVKRLLGWKYLIENQTDNLIQGKYINCVVTEVDPYKRYPIQVSYQLYDTNGNAVEETTNCTEEELLIEKYD